MRYLTTTGRSYFQGKLIERLYHSPVGPAMVRIYDLLHRNEKFKVYTIFGDILIEINPSRPGERGIPFYAFEPIVTNEFLSVIKEGDVVFDVGAWIGYYTILAAKKVGIKGKVISIEPYDENLDRIKRNVQINNFSNVTILGIGVGDTATTGTLLKGESSLMNKVVLDHNKGNSDHNNAKKIEMDSLDNIINKLAIEEIRILILDVEGYEFIALTGLENSLRKHIVKNILCEIHPKMLLNNRVSEGDVANMLSQYGYATRTIDKQDKTSPYHIFAAVT